MTTPLWLKKELAQEKVAVAGQCRYPDGYTAINVGKGRGTDDSRCFLNRTHGPMRVDPSPVVGNINQDLGINFRLDQVLGGPNAVCASTGTVDWGDGTSSPLAITSITATARAHTTAQ